MTFSVVQLENPSMSEELFLEDFDDTSIFENKAGLAEVTCNFYKFVFNN